LFVTGLITGGFSSFIRDYLATGGSLGNSIVYATNVTQNISGNKTFLNGPYVPYTGASGQVVAKRYVDDQITAINTYLLPLAGSTFVYDTGSQTISGNKTFAGTWTAINYISRSGFGTSGFGINVTDSSLVDGNGTESLNWNNKTFSNTWTFNSAPLINGSNPVLIGGTQTITGDKVFTGDVKVKTATSTFNPVPYYQFQDALNATGEALNSLLILSASGSASGFGGVLSFNGVSGNIFTQGRGNVTVWQQGNILNISGAELTTGTADSVFAVSRTGLATGSNVYRINFSDTYDSIPFVFAQLVNSSGNPTIGYHLSGVNTSGFSVAFSDTLSDNGYSLNYFVFEESGILNLLRGEQGLLGPYLTPRGNWSTGATYSYLDFAYINGVSWVAKTGHLSVTNTHPTGVSGSIYWNLLASGTGPKGDNGTIFAYTGPWNSAVTYTSGEAVIYNGASYAFTGASSLNEIPTGSPWFVVAARGEQGLRYQGSFATGTVYSGGDIVTFNHQTFALPVGSTSTGLSRNPSSSVGEWEPLQDRSVVFNGDYSSSRIYYKNDLAASTTGFGVLNRAQYIWTRDEPILSLHPEGKYNIFTDCDAVTGYNLFTLGVASKTNTNPAYGLGGTNDFLLNLNDRNNGGSGFDTLILIRGEVYYFDNEMTGVPFILSAQPTGGTFTNQYITNVKTGSRLLVDETQYAAMGLNQSLRSGTLRFAPGTGEPDDLYLCSPTTGYVGWHLKVVTTNPWSVFTSGVQGASGVSGAVGSRGAQGLAFVWKGTWSPISGYNSGESVFYSGSSYATNQFTIGTAPSHSPWFTVASKGDAGADAQGLAFVWKGSWDSATSYTAHDSVYYLGSSYATTGAPPLNYNPVSHPEYWFLVAKSGTVGSTGPAGTGIEFMWRGNYSPSRTYASGDAVHYNGTSYVTTGASATGVLPSTGLVWNIIAQGGGVLFNWQGTWSPSTNYQSGHAVFYSGSSFACFESNFNDRPGSTSSVWSLVSQKGDTGPSGARGADGPRGTGGLAFEWRGTWSNSVNYAPNDAVYFNGSSYGTLDTVTGALRSTIPAQSANWFLLSQKGDAGLAFVWKGNWTTGTLYRPYESVYYSGRSYATITYASSGFRPGTAPWFVIADKGDVFVNQSYYAGPGAPATGLGIWESFIGKSTTVTGFAWSLNTQGTAGENLSGSIYKKTLAGVKTNLINFTITTGSGYYWSGSASKAISALDRLGIDLSGGALTSAAGLLVGIFGNAPSD
jgi:hypothetical protein